MSSQRRIQSSRANGALSRGPITPEGKAASAQNARTHQLTAATVVLTNEDAPVLEDMLATYASHFAPRNPIEADLIEELAVAKWRQRRLWAIESAAIDLEMDVQQQEVDVKYETIDQPTRLALAYKSLNDHSKLLSNLSRYESRHRRAYEKAVAQLENKNGKNEPSPIPEQQPASEIPR
jgi:hypothetical protein